MKNEEFAATQGPFGKEAAGRALYGLIGFPLGHSFSRGFFTEKFARENIDAEYRNFEIPDASMLLDVIRQHPNLRGLNVTLPHKQAVIPFLHAMSDEAREIGAVNVIKVERLDNLTISQMDKESSEKDVKLSNCKLSNCQIHLTGFNSDIIGFSESIRPLLQPWHTKALVLGTGGASKAICVGLKRLGLEWTNVSRKAKAPSPLPLWGSASAPENSSEQKHSPKGGAGRGLLAYSDLTADVMQEYTVIVNCTPVGMFPKVNAAPDIPYECLTPRHLLFDCVYNPEDTLFMQKGRAQGAVVKNGLEMLHLQALASWRFWNDL